ncbi:glycosyltransferase family 2 protein [Streptomyces sp. ID05-39B]|uniref:glycosyltransferase family 2 protein n=1 Tax=Streptomyces sp. ID05-39B TaxID=3028664 RepID=UPI0029A38533|nr:glycosyltransferase family 2 protein [Streptomyces sp. ID05-39B]MDX3527714.1 glycosyltransferase family 2 protein [Streptomyces sp. ID05-39B]
MIDGKRVLIIMPAWNEADGVADVIKEVHTTLPGVDVLVVDDGSVDETSAVARAAGATVMTLPYNLGVGGAMRAGYRYAHDRGYDVAIQVDADGQHDPRNVPELLERLDQADLIIGARFAGTGEYETRGPRKWAMVVLAFWLSRMARSKLTDVTSGFRACNRDLINVFARWYPVEYLGDTVESTIAVVRAGYRIDQVPVSMRPRTTGTPSQSPWKATLYLGRIGMILLLALSRRSELGPAKQGR